MEILETVTLKGILYSTVPDLHNMNKLHQFIVFLLLVILTVLTYIFIRNPNFYTQLSSLQEIHVSTQISKPRIFLNISRISCPCDGSELKYVLPPERRNESEQLRLADFMQHQMRKKTKVDNIILSPPNSPLQYPIYGVTVMPLKKSEIPALELHTSKRNRYKVSLSVQHGVLSVSNNNVEEVEVVGQEQSTLTISSEYLSKINHLLSTLMYTSTRYHIEMTDLVYYSYEEYMAVFPILIKRPVMPILPDPGKDVNTQVSIVTKTFLRYNQLNTLINSIRNLYPEIKIIVADDSFNPQQLNGTNIEQYIMPPAQGWFAGRNLGLSQVTTKYFLWVDDDFVFRDNTRIESFLEIMEAVPELDVVGGAVDGNQFFFTLHYEEGDEEGGCLRRQHHKWHAPVPGFPNCYYVDGVVNFFLARTHKLQQVGFDPFLKRVAHTEFFIDGLGTLLVATCKGLSVGHQKRANHKTYWSYRHQYNTNAKLIHHYFKNHLKCIKY